MPKILVGVKGYSVEEAAKLLNITEYTVRVYLREGKLRGRKIGGLWFIPEDNIKSFVLESEGEVNGNNLLKE